MAIYSDKWRALKTTVMVGTTQPEGLAPAAAAVRATLRALESTDRAALADVAVAAAMRAAQNGGVLVSLGPDIATAGEPPPGGWQVFVGSSEDDPLDGGDLGRIAIRGGALATSTVSDASQWRSVTVAARSCVDAETAAAAAIQKDDCAIGWLGRRRLAARLVETDGTVHYIGRWPDPTEDAA